MLIIRRKLILLNVCTVLVWGMLTFTVSRFMRRSRPFRNGDGYQGVGVLLGMGHERMTLSMVWWSSKVGIVSLESYRLCLPRAALLQLPTLRTPRVGIRKQEKGKLSLKPRPGRCFLQERGFSWQLLANGEKLLPAA
jgi:hypothetical protein